MKKPRAPESASSTVTVGTESPRPETVVRFTQEQLRAAYKQMSEEREAERMHAENAGKILGKTMGFRIDVLRQHYQIGLPETVTPDPVRHVLAFCLHQRSDWWDCIRRLEEAGVKMKPWSGRMGERVEGEYVIPENVEWPENAQKKFELHILYSDNPDR